MGSYTVVGNVGREIRLNDGPGGKWLTFSVCETRRYVDRQTGEWRDGTPTWVEVKVSGDLAVHAEKSLRTGQRVIVHGELGERHWTANDGTQRSRFRLNAVALGHDLRWGVSSFAKWTTDEGWRSARPAAVNPATGELGNGPWESELPGQGAAPAAESFGSRHGERDGFAAFDARSLVSYDAPDEEGEAGDVDEAALRSTA